MTGTYRYNVPQNLLHAAGHCGPYHGHLRADAHQVLIIHGNTLRWYLNKYQKVLLRPKSIALWAKSNDRSLYVQQHLFCMYTGPRGWHTPSIICPPHHLADPVPIAGKHASLVIMVYWVLMLCVDRSLAQEILPLTSCPPWPAGRDIIRQCPLVTRSIHQGYNMLICNLPLQSDAKLLNRAPYRIDQITIEI